MKKTTLLISVAIVVIVILSFYIGSYYFSWAKKEITIKIFSAGSLSIPLEKIKDVYQKTHPNVKIEIESSGSVLAVRKVIELGKKADIVAVADYILIPKMMMPKWVNWYVMFATNKIVVAFTNKSRYADKINADNWYKILLKDDVRFGFSNPNLDPCGYRSLFVIAMASKYYDDSSLEDFVIRSSNIKIVKNSSFIDILVPEDFNVSNTEKIIIRDKSVSLISLLEAGVLDYAFEYQSVAKQHKLRYIPLPDNINLASLKYAENYKKYRVHLYYGTSKEQIIQGQPITYGLTVPKNVDKNGVFDFLRYMLSSEGLEVFRNMGQEPILPPVGVGNIPEELDNIVVKK